jgi:DNA replication protein DnaC
MQRLLAAKRDLRLPQELSKLDRFACVILDDIGYVRAAARRNGGLVYLFS